MLVKLLFEERKMNTKKYIMKGLMVFIFLGFWGCGSLISTSQISGRYDSEGFFIVKYEPGNERNVTLFRFTGELEKDREVNSEVNIILPETTFYIGKYIEAKHSGFIGVGTKRVVQHNRVYFNSLIACFDRNGQRTRANLLNDNGELLYVIRVPNGDYIAIGWQRLNKGGKGIAVRFNSDCDVVWHKLFQDSETVNQVLLTSDGELLFAGWEFSDIREIENKKLFLAKYTLDGEQIWQALVDISDGWEATERFTPIIETREGNYIVGGSTVFGKDDDSIFFACFDPGGNIIWKTIARPRESGSFSYPPIISDMRELMNKDFIVVGSMDPFYNKGFLSKMSSTGNEIWTTETKRISTKYQKYNQ